MSKRKTSSVVAVALALVVASVAMGGVAVAELTADASVADDGGPSFAAQNMTETPTEDNETMDGEDVALIRAVHASPDAPNVDVYFDGELALSDVPFGTVGEYLEVAAGEHTFTVTVAGNESAVVFDDTIDLEANERYSAVALGEVTEGAENPFNVTLLQDAAVEAAEGNSTVRLVHAAPDAPAVDVVVNGTDTVLFENVSFGEASDYVSVPAGDYTLDVRPAGENTTVASFDVTVESGTAYTAFAVGYLDPDAAAGDEPFDLVVGVDVAPEEDVGTPTEEGEDGMTTETPGEDGMETPTEGNMTVAGGV